MNCSYLAVLFVFFFNTLLTYCNEAPQTIIEWQLYIIIQLYELLGNALCTPNLTRLLIIFEVVFFSDSPLYLLSASPTNSVRFDTLFHFNFGVFALFFRLCLSITESTKSFLLLFISSTFPGR